MFYGSIVAGLFCEKIKTKKERGTRCHALHCVFNGCAIRASAPEQELVLPGQRGRVLEPGLGQARPQEPVQVRQPGLLALTQARAYRHLALAP